MIDACPCCRTTAPILMVSAGDGIRHCSSCGHSWRNSNLPADYYARCAGRNHLAEGIERKFRDRMASVEPLLWEGMRILEVGCADGAFGAAIKQRIPLFYAGLELSPDAETAAECLDHVHRHPVQEMATDETGSFDLVLSFHVLEHIADIHAEMATWRRLLRQDGQLIVEVPHRAGHRLLDLDRNPEHLHLFSTASLAIVLERAGLDVERIDTGHFESSVYSDSIRAVARPAQSVQQKREALLARFRKHLPGPFVVYGLGGDFRNYVEPLLPDLNVAALCDGSPARFGQKIAEREICRYDPAMMAELPILIASTRHTAEIQRNLRAQGVSESRMVRLNELYA